MYIIAYRNKLKIIFARGNRYFLFARLSVLKLSSYYVRLVCLFHKYEGLVPIIYIDHFTPMDYFPTDTSSGCVTSAPATCVLDQLNILV